MCYFVLVVLNCFKWSTTKRMTSFTQCRQMSEHDVIAQHNSIWWIMERHLWTVQSILWYLAIHHAWTGQPTRVWEWNWTSRSDLLQKTVFYILHERIIMKLYCQCGILFHHQNGVKFGMVCEQGIGYSHSKFRFSSLIASMVFTTMVPFFGNCVFKKFISQNSLEISENPAFQT